MRVAVMGGTGFIGTDLIKLLLQESDIEPVVITTSPRNLTNVARFDIEISHIPILDIASTGIGHNYDAVINLAHPFETRDRMTPKQQVKTLAKAFAESLDTNRDLRLVHVSSMSVYEPFKGNRVLFSEAAAINVPRGDPYAALKARFEQYIANYASSDMDRVSFPRPTVVYGPFCRPWTDRLLQGFLMGDVPYVSLDGRIQPIYVRDFSRFLLQALREPHVGALNVGGFEPLTWKEFIGFFQEIAEGGDLVQSACRTQPSKNGIRSDLRRVFAALAGDPAFRRRARPFARLIPSRRRDQILRGLREKPLKATPSTPTEALCTPFFGKDRLVSIERLKQVYPTFAPRPLDKARSVMERYAAYRFSDAPLES